MSRVGEIHETKNYGKVTIIDYENSRNCTVQFEDGNTVKSKSYSDIIRGMVRNPYHPTNVGVGYIGEGEKRNIHIYNTWLAILQRCYDVRVHLKQESYKDSTVSEDWKNFQNYADWHEHHFDKGYMKGWQLDKDILVKGNKEYSRDKCCFVPHEINSLFTKNNISRGGNVIGVDKQKDKFRASINKKQKTINLGTYVTEIEAFQAYKKVKEDYIKEIADKWKGKIADNVYEAMHNYQVEITD